MIISCSKAVRVGLGFALWRMTIAVITFVCLGAAFYGPVKADNSVFVESKIVVQGQTGVTVGLYISNDIQLQALYLPFQLRTISNEAYISGTFTFTGSNRIANEPFGQGGFLYYYNTWNPGANCWSDGDNEPNADGSPDAVSWGRWVIWDSLPAGYDPVGRPSFVFEFDVNDHLGSFEIDTTCMAPANHLQFVDYVPPFEVVIPVFTKSVITIVEAQEAEMAYWPDCGCPNPDGITQDVVTNSYGPRYDSRYLPPYSYHDGIDIDLEDGDPVHAILDGNVDIVRFESERYGWYVKTISECYDHSGIFRAFYVLYHHMDEPLVQEEDIILKSGIIANCKEYPPPIWTHLHLEIQPDHDINKSAHPVRYLTKPEVSCPMFDYDEWQLLPEGGPYDYLECTSLSQKDEKYDLASIHVFVYTTTDSREAIIDFENSPYMKSTGPSFQFFEGTPFDVTITLTPQQGILGDTSTLHIIDIIVDPVNPFASDDYIGIYLEDLDTVKCIETGLCNTEPLFRRTSDFYCPSIGNVTGISPAIMLEFFEGRWVEDNCVELCWRGAPGVDAATVRIFRAANGGPERVIHDGAMPFRGGSSDTLRFFDYSVSRSDELVYRMAVEFHNGASILAEQKVCLDSQESQTENIPSSFHLEQNYPNPFNSGTSINFAVEDENADRVTLEIFNILGQHITTIFEEENPAQDHYSVNWNGRDSKGRPVASGVYFYRLKTAANQISKSMVLIR